MKRTALAAAFAALCLACSSGPLPEPPAPPPPPPPPALDPAGTFDIALELQGEVIEGVMVIEATDDGHGGSISAMGNAVDITDFTADGLDAFFAVYADGFSVTFEVVFEEDGSGFSGFFDSEMGGGSVIGTKR